jgi:hypothetical protein
MILEIAGAKLILVYPIPMRKILSLIVRPNDGYCALLRAYYNSDIFMNERYN